MAKSITISDEAYQIVLQLSSDRKLMITSKSEIPKTMSKIVSKLIIKELKQ